MNLSRIWHQLQMYLIGLILFLLTQNLIALETGFEGSLPLGIYRSYGVEAPETLGTLCRNQSISKDFGVGFSIRESFSNLANVSATLGYETFSVDKFAGTPVGECNNGRLISHYSLTQNIIALRLINQFQIVDFDDYSLLFDFGLGYRYVMANSINFVYQGQVSTAPLEGSDRYEGTDSIGQILGISARWKSSSTNLPFFIQFSLLFERYFSIHGETSLSTIALDFLVRPSLTMGYRFE